MSTTPTNAYQGLDLQYIAGEWRPGSSDRTADNLNPFDGSVLGTIKLASRADVDAAYAAAKAAQVEWAASAPGTSRYIFRCARSLRRWPAAMVWC